MSEEKKGPQPIKAYKLDENGKKIPLPTPLADGEKYYFDLFTKLQWDGIPDKSAWRLASPAEAGEPEDEEDELTKLRKQLEAAQAAKADLEKKLAAAAKLAEKAKHAAPAPTPVPPTPTATPNANDQK